MRARSVAAGHGDGADLVMRDDLVRDIVADEHHVEQALGQTRFEAQVAQQQPGAGADRGGDEVRHVQSDFKTVNFL